MPEKKLNPFSLSAAQKSEAVTMIKHHYKALFQTNLLSLRI
ncbi:MAG: hypothetical protein ABIH76_01345 [Candidatus Bathyarchaeota archaeon]